MSNGRVDKNSSPLARVIVPIVEGQLRSYMKAHPDHFAKAPAKGIVASMAKRIINDLLSSATVARLTEALGISEASEEASMPCAVCADATGAVAGNCDTRKPDKERGAQ